MSTLHLILIVAAFILFLIAAFQSYVNANVRVRLECLGFALLTLTLLV